MDVAPALVGDRRPRNRVLVLAVAVPLVASVTFLLGSNVFLGAPIALGGLLVAAYAGWLRAGALAAWAPVFLAVLWRFVFPPLVGYLRGSGAVRYTPPRLLGYKLDPAGELAEGIAHGPGYALAGAVLLGGGAYVVGAVLRQVGDRVTTAGPSESSP